MNKITKETKDRLNHFSKNEFFPLKENISWEQMFLPAIRGLRHTFTLLNAARMPLKTYIYNVYGAFFKFVGRL